jgi:hypothetical protein
MIKVLLLGGMMLLCLSIADFANADQNDLQVAHPAGVIKAADLQRAQENLQRYDWAKDYLAKLQKNTDYWLPQLTPQFLEQMIPETTPGDSLYTPCPACRDLGKPYLPHGNWSWDPKHPEELKCNVCGTVFPNSKYPESVVLHTTWGKPQTLTFMGGEPFPVFAYKQARPSISGNIRARKVSWISSLLDNIGEAYALTGKPEYAKTAHDILVRFAAVYPYWLVHEGYGEYADMDPQIAADHINALPQNELVYPPNKPDRKLITGYWSAGRASATGMEGTFVRRVAGAYDLTCDAKNADGSAIYNDADRADIEKNLLLESTKLLVADKQINNKAVGNRCAAGIVGLVVGDPKLVRFGMEGFDLTVNSWFLPDGGTPESPAYAMMTLGGTAQFVQALRDYSDPPGYHDANGKRYDHFDPYHDTNYGKVWDAMFNTLQGDLLYPPFADSYQTTRLSASYSELMADNYPDRPQYLSLLKEYINGDWSKVYAPWALYYGEPGRDTKVLPPLTLPSNILPDLRIGYMRSGADGRESLLLLSASHWGSHHHQDSLNLYYWKNGEELLTDLGYLWDHPDKHMNVRTLAHNTVMIDEKDQVTRDRGGDVTYFLDKPHVRAMRASSKAYPAAAVYERASTLIDHGDGNNYAVDVFWAQGGATQDYIYHGPNQKFHIDANVSAATQKLYDFSNVRQVQNAANTSWKINWDINDKLQFTAWNLPATNETSLLGDGWGQRDSKNKDRGVTIPYIVRRATGTGLHTFVSVFEGHAPDDAYIQKISPLVVQGDSNGVIALQIDTTDSHDYIVISQTRHTLSVNTPDGIIRCSGQLAVLSMRDGKSTFANVDSGELQLNGKVLTRSQ